MRINSTILVYKMQCSFSIESRADISSGNQCYTFRVEKNLIFISESVKDVGNFKLSMEYSMLKGFQVNGTEFVVEDGSISLERRSICSGLGPRWSDTIKG